MASKGDEITWKSKCAIKDWNETYDILTDTDPIEAKASCRTKGGKARAHAKARNYRNGHFSSEAGASAAALKDGDLEALRAEAGAGAEVGPGGALGMCLLHRGCTN